MTEPKAPLCLAVLSGDFDRVHYALATASAAAALDRPVTLLFTHRALYALLAEDAEGRPGWHDLDRTADGEAPADRDRALAERGVASFEELLAACVALGVAFLACEMGLAAMNLADEPVRGDIPVKRGGLAGLIATAAPPVQLAFV